MTKQEIREVIRELDDDIRKLLSLVNLIKIDFIVGNKNGAIDKLEKSINLAQKIESDLRSLDKLADERAELQR
ncbi:MAG: hypothetical protein JHC26_00525 [Thermofilum sp.]|uniref:hypothetical protein n=1 Tax=Thermofilum sp. TaxID=1961369 RepID=UPI002589EF26|nr:hypothetical protein [Thermofilum sp.]MCI4407550.1 hypothetical protein [Thermofilum sp.]